MRNKKGQISYFMLVGIVIIITGAFFIFLNSSQQVIPDFSISNDVKPFYLSFEKCIETTTYNGIREIGLKGGFLDFQDPHFTSNSVKVNYALYNESITFPELYEIELYLDEYIANNISDCIDFSQFKNFKFNDNGIRVNSTINTETINVLIDWDLELEKSSQNVKSIYHLPATYRKYPISFINIYSITESIAIKSLLDPDYVDVIFLLGQYSNITYSVYNNDTVVFLITDNEVFENQPYNFVFGVGRGSENE